MLPPARFEHIAIAVPAAALFAWDRLLRGAFGGTAGLGGAERRSGFQGGQILYPEGGMLELLSWLPESSGGAMERYVHKHGGEAALHHLTFLVDDLDAALDHARACGYEPMIGRRGPHWDEFFLREPGMRPAGMLIQVLRADKDALRESGWTPDWAPFAVQHGANPAPARIAGVTLATRAPADTERLFATFLGGERAAGGAVFTWPDSGMHVALIESEDAGESFVTLGGGVDLAAALGDDELAGAARVLRTPLAP